MFVNNLKDIILNNKDLFYKKIHDEIKILNKQIDNQKLKKMIVLENYSVIIMNSVTAILNEWTSLLNDVKQTLEYVAINIEKLEMLKKQLNIIENLMIEIEKKKEQNEDYNELFLELNNKLEEYSELLTNVQLEVLENTSIIEGFNEKIIFNLRKIVIETHMVVNYKPKMEEAKKEEIINKNEVKGNMVEDSRLLLISEKDNKIYLPYVISELQERLRKDKKYNTVEDLIQNEYILDYNKFSSPVISRFKEAYKLVKKRSKGTIVDAIQLGMELMFNYSLNPAIIVACRNEDELDIYLDCLEENELELFKIFDIKYEIMPVKL